MVVLVKQGGNTTQKEDFNSIKLQLLYQFQAKILCEFLGGE